MEIKKVHSSFWSNFFRGNSRVSETAVILRTIPPFSTFSKRDLQQICNIMHIRTYIPGEYIFYQGDPGIGIYLIEEGTVEIQRIDDSGSPYALAQFSKGDFFGELALVDGAKRSASAVALSDCRISVLFKPELDEYIDKYPKKGVKILQGLSLIVISRLRKLNEENFNLQKELNREKIHGTEY